MGKLFYGSDARPIEIDDRLLQYLQVVLATKLRRGESFTLTWTDLASEHSRTTLWVQPSIAMRFQYSSPEPERLSGAYLRRLADQAAMSSGLMLDAATWQRQESTHREVLNAAA
ncbi:von Willebrand factor A [Microbacterium sp. SUBG005]|nr:von Willebrand factor A [Microbacterium sp. SUBG005]